MRRRAFIAGAGTSAALWPLASGAQAPKLPKIGVLVAGTPDPAAFLEGFREGLRAHGFVDGQSIRLDIRSAGGKPERLDGLAHDLVATNADIIVCFQTPTCTAAARATHRIPIVAEAGDLVGTGLVRSLAHPGGNLTGVSGSTDETAAKDLEVLRELLPAARHVGALCNVADPFSKPFLAQLQSAAPAVGFDVIPAFARGPAEMEAGFKSLFEKKVDALVVQPSLGAEGPAQLALKLRMPAASPNRPFAKSGGLVAYSADQRALYRKMADFVSKILKGAKPTDMPVELPTTFDLVINAKTAKTLGIAVPPALLATADEVIE